MRFVIFGPDRRLGVLDGAHVVDAALAYERFLGRARPAEALRGAEVVPSALLGFIEGGRRSLEELERALSGLRASGDLAVPDNDLVFEGPTLHAPFPGQRVACAGSNYSQHSAGMALARGVDLGGDNPDAAVRQRGMWGFLKWSEPVGPGAKIAYPSRTHKFDYEGEAAIVIGRTGSDIASAKARDYIWGVSLAVDWSIRDNHELPQSKFAMHKNFDGSFSFGPCVVVDETSADAVEVKTFVNGELRQHYNSATMVFSFEEFIEYLSRDMTLRAGDIISGGTGAGTAMDTSKLDKDTDSPIDRFLHAGDHVLVTSPQIGDLSAEIVAKAAAV